MESNTYWLFGWLEMHDINDEIALSKILKKRQIINELKAAAKNWWENTPSISKTSGSLLAGSGLDFLSPLSCASKQCRLLQVDTLFRHAWHYFDKIYLPDFIGEVMINSEVHDEKKLYDDLFSKISVVMKIKTINAADLVVFYPKSKILDSLPDSCKFDTEEIENIKKVFYEILDKDFKYSTEKVKGGFTLHFSHPLLRTDTLNIEKFESSNRKMPKKSDRKSILINELFDLIMPDVFVNYLVAQEFNAPIGSTVPIHGKIMESFKKDATINEIAFQLDFPIVGNIPIQDLLLLRRDNLDSFDSFRQSIREALLLLKNNIELSNINSKIESDIIKPSLLNLSNKLSKAQNAYNKKKKVAMTLGTITTLCGLFTGLTLDVSASAGIATTAGLIGKSKMKLIEDIKEVEENKFFFLWKALHSN